MDKIKNYVTLSGVATRKMIRDSMDRYALTRKLKLARGYHMGTHENK